MEGLRWFDNSPLGSGISLCRELRLIENAGKFVGLALKGSQARACADFGGRDEIKLVDAFVCFFHDETDFEHKVGV